MIRRLPPGPQAPSHAARLWHKLVVVAGEAAQSGLEVVEDKAGGRVRHGRATDGMLVVLSEEDATFLECDLKLNEMLVGRASDGAGRRGELRDGIAHRVRLIVRHRARDESARAGDDRCGLDLSREVE